MSSIGPSILLVLVRFSLVSLLIPPNSVISSRSDPVSGRCIYPYPQMNKLNRLKRTLPVSAVKILIDKIQTQTLVHLELCDSISICIIVRFQGRSLADSDYESTSVIALIAAMEGKILLDPVSRKDHVRQYNQPFPEYRCPYGAYAVSADKLKSQLERHNSLTRFARQVREYSRRRILTQTSYFKTPAAVGSSCPKWHCGRHLVTGNNRTVRYQSHTNIRCTTVC